ncbi:hypothetical protein [Streptosporangium carneum]|uniref:ATP synthase F0 subunit B n=1 Tax=Streptosporangium carneum TaxID=47481 RepID=A0A9W6MBD2_9ACTN|nr:hypothetical protein [Streptosporangium carneum]GLK07543.1 hypothetical protein GCM10017600_09480 [Streptosporangium carneum]
MSEYPTGPDRGAGQSGGLQATAQQGKAAVGEVAETAKDQAQAVAAEAREQARQAVGQLRERAGEQAREQSRRAAQGIRQWADELNSMSEAAKPDSPVNGVVQQVANRGHQAADYLERHGLAGVVQEVQTFARRRPGVFLAAAAAAGFLAGRIAKATTGATQSSSGTGQTYPDSSSGTGQAYPTTTGTGQPYSTGQTYPDPTGPGSYPGTGVGGSSSSTGQGYSGVADPLASLGTGTRPASSYPPVEEPPATGGWGGERR